MKLLLDTHALLWWATLDAGLSAKARRAIGDDDSEVFVSAASVWEIATKVRLGKLVWPLSAGTVVAYGAQPAISAALDFLGARRTCRSAHACAS